MADASPTDATGAASGDDPSDVTLDRWIAAVEALDAPAAAACLAENAVFRSATTAEYEYTSRAHIQEMEEVMFALFDTLHVEEVVGDGDTRAVRLSFMLRGTGGEEMKLVRFGPDGLIREMTVYVRTLPALATIPAHAGPALARRAGRPWLARMIAMSSRPVAAMLRNGDRSMAPLTDPARR